MNGMFGIQQMALPLLQLMMQQNQPMNNNVPEEEQQQQRQPDILEFLRLMAPISMASSSPLMMGGMMGGGLPFDITRL